MWVVYLLISIFVLYLLRKYFNGPITPLRKSMKGKIVIVTGASAGLGKVTALQLLEDGAQVIFAGRDKVKTENIINEIKNSENQKRAHFIRLDLSSFSSVKKFVEEFISRFSKVNVLVNNAGSFPSELTNRITEDNICDIWQGNVLSHIALTHLLLDYFDKNDSKIINVSSMASKLSNITSKQIEDFKNANDFKLVKEYFYSSLKRKNDYYSFTKIANVFYSQALAEYLERNYPYIKTASLHPGVVPTEFQRGYTTDYSWIKYALYLLYPLIWFLSKDQLSGAQTQLHLCYINKEDLINGAYYHDCHVGKFARTEKNEELKNSLIGWCETSINSSKILNTKINLKS
jgi:retinol dehydrogenase-12